MNSGFVSSEYILVCGLGSLGQQSVLALKRFGVAVSAIEQKQLTQFDIPGLPTLLDQFIIGDCAYEPTLDQLDWPNCRAVIIATSNDQINIETALLARQRSATTRLVVRCSKLNLNQLLEEKLGNFIAYDPLELPANAYALAALGSETLGFFKLSEQWLHVVHRSLPPNHSWIHQFKLYELNNKSRRILAHRSLNNPWPTHFSQFDQATILHAHDELIYIELIDHWQLKQDNSARRSPRSTVVPRSMSSASREITHSPHGKSQKFIPLTLGLKRLQHLKHWLTTRPVVLLAAIMIISLLAIGTFLLHISLPQTQGWSAFYSTAVLLLGGYGDLFEKLEEAEEYRWLVQLLALLLTLAGTAMVGILYALLTENLLAQQFTLIRKRVPVPERQHVVIIGLGRVGKRVANLLKEWRQPFVCVSFSTPDPNAVQRFPVINESLPECLTQANLAEAKSVLVLTDKDLLNLEVALLTQKLNEDAELIIRTNKSELSRALIGLLPQAQVLDAYSLAAEVFVGAAFGENILNLFQLNQNTILVAEYQIEAHDTLIGLLMGEVSCGYKVIPIWYQSANASSAHFFPSDDIILRNGDRLIILATINGLKKIEVRDLAQKTWRVRVEKVRHQDDEFEGANTLSRITGCSLQTARTLMENLPQTLSKPLYESQALRLIRALKKLQIKASLQKI